MGASRPAIALVVVVALAGCSEQALDDLQGELDEAIDQAQSELGELDPSDLDLPDVELPAVGDGDGDPTAEPTPDDEVAAPQGTASEATASPSPTSTASEGPVPTDEGEVAGLPWWAWLLVVLVLVAILAALTHVRRREAARAARRAELRDAALTDVDWLLDRTEERPVAVDAAARARDVRVRADRLDEALVTLATIADEDRAPVVRDLRTQSRLAATAIIDRLDHVAAGRDVDDAWGPTERLRAERTRFADMFGDVGTDEPRRRW